MKSLVGAVLRYSKSCNRWWKRVEGNCNTKSSSTLASRAFKPHRSIEQRQNKPTK